MTDYEMGAKLRKRRESLGLDQDYLGAKINRTQSAISLIENGKVKFTEKLIKEIKSVEGFEDFDQESLEPADILNAREVFLLKWRW